MYKKKLNLVNGVLFTGGSSKAGLYFDVVEEIVNQVLKKNDAGDLLQQVLKKKLFLGWLLLYVDAFLLMSKAMRNTKMKKTGEIERDREEIEKKNDDHDHLQVSKRLQPWTKHITIRGVIASIIIGSIYAVIAMKLNLTTGMTPNLNVSAALLGFVYIKTSFKDSS
ncbi:hypothetical protein Ccrd_022115 [Cynara cardunculus var. scolymus]|uniref:Oligopeptide transporter OPT superfamily n=1 Tax=Cynara cardunculus var. scolymus TaxID=59895 RepID=A0A124SEB9_CYNCS|nr:hypothetical protein Ccrd_022115 [Cynara cardunculus var. scolymus]